MAQEPSPNQLVPFRWPSGWTAANLSLLAGGPINCLLLDTFEHPVAEPARGAGLVVREWGSLGAAPLAKTRWDAGAPIVALTEVAWPQIKPVVRGANAESGPTGVPWIDSTSWVSRLAASRAPSKQIWLAFDPPGDLVLGAAAYRLAIADCAATGARWAISLDPKLAAALASGDAQALAAWRQMNDTLAFFEKRAAWRSYRVQGPLGRDFHLLGSQRIHGHRGAEPGRAAEPALPGDRSHGGRIRGPGRAARRAVGRPRDASGAARRQTLRLRPRRRPAGLAPRRRSRFQRRAGARLCRVRLRNARSGQGRNGSCGARLGRPVLRGPRHSQPG